MLRQREGKSARKGLTALAIAAACLVAMACASSGPVVEKDPAPDVENVKPEEPGRLDGARIVYYLGVDFSEAVFADPEFEIVDLAGSKVPSWNRRAIDNIIVRIAVPLVTDLDTSTARNALVKSDQLLPADTAPPDASPLTAEDLRERIAPYVDPSADGPALLFWIQSVTRDIGITGYYVVFEQSDGAILLQARVVGAPEGTGIHHYYLNALHEISEAAMQAINREAAGTVANTTAG